MNCPICLKNFTSETYKNHLLYCHNIKLEDQIQTEKFKNAEIIKPNIIKKECKSDKCVICLVNDKTTAFFRCGHKVCCYNCAKKILNSTNKLDKRCPVCRKIVGGILRIYD